MADKHKLGPSSLELDGALLVPQCPSLEQPCPPASHAPLSPTAPNRASSTPRHSLPECLASPPSLTGPHTSGGDLRMEQPKAPPQWPPVCSARNRTRAQVGRSIPEPAPVPAQHDAVRNSQDTLQAAASAAGATK